MSVSEKKEIFHALLRKWNKAYNLVQPSSLKDFEKRHWKNSLQLSKYIPKDAPEKFSVLDVGSGAGFPGIVLGILGYRVTLSEKNPKKIIFLKEAIRSCDLSSHVNLCEGDVYTLTSFFDVVTSRAFSSLDNLLKIQKNVSRETRKVTGLFLKGVSYQEELEEARKKWSFNLDIYPSEGDGQGVILRIENLSLLS